MGQDMKIQNKLFSSSDYTGASNGPNEWIQQHQMKSLWVEYLNEHYVLLHNGGISDLYYIFYS
jgi:hypothetical protein